MDTVFEIERRYLIRYPDLTKLEELCSVTEIVQTYLLPDETWPTNRVRKRGREGEYSYTHTRKRRVSEIRRIEEEIIISEEEYLRLLERKDPERNVINKLRFCCPYNGKIFEIDIFSFWSDRAIMEIELNDEREHFDIPPFIDVIREISNDGRYTNAALAKEIPDESI